MLRVPRAGMVSWAGHLKTPYSETQMSLAKFLSRFPEADEAHVAAILRDDQITTSIGRSRAFFYAQIAHETGGFRRFEENLRYSAPRLMAVWPSRFPTRAMADRYANQPEMLANFVYGGRLGNTEAGDGWRFRGRGYVQLTGRKNYTALGIDDKPDLASDPEHALSIADLWWHQNMRPADFVNIEANTRRLNGGQVGIEERHRNFEWALDDGLAG